MMHRLYLGSCIRVMISSFGLTVFANLSITDISVITKSKIINIVLERCEWTEKDWYLWG